jgi:hypothetical protein
MKGLTSDEKRSLPPEARLSRRYRLSEKEIELITMLRDTGTVPPEYLVHTDRAITKVLARYTELQRRYKASLVELNRVEEQMDVLLALRKQFAKDKLNLRSRTSAKRSETIPVLIMSDIHYGQVVDPATVSGLNEYNAEIARKSIAECFSKGAYLIKLFKTQTAVKTIALAWLGDFISGEIHPELREGNDRTAIEASIELKQYLSEGCEYLLDETKAERLVIACTPGGNHGRTTKETRHGTAWKNNFEYLLYADMAWHYAKTKPDKRITVKLSKSYHNTLDLFGKYRLRLHHGNNIRYAGGVGGISIPVIKKVDKWNKAMPSFLDIFGHFHQFRFGGSWICCPSMVGFDPYAISIGADYEEPAQLLLGIEKTRGLTKLEPILLGPRSNYARCVMPGR